jgi:hypothetical protein
LPSAITSYTWNEVVNKELKIDSVFSKPDIIQTPSFSEFKFDSGMYVWSNDNTILQLVECENFRFKASCEKHNASYQLSMVGGNSYFLCSNVVQSAADFSQITAVLIYNNLIPLSKDLCLKKSIDNINNH